MRKTIHKRKHRNKRVLEYLLKQKKENEGEDYGGTTRYIPNERN